MGKQVKKVVKILDKYLKLVVGHLYSSYSSHYFYMQLKIFTIKGKNEWIKINKKHFVCLERPKKESLKKRSWLIKIIGGFQSSNFSVQCVGNINVKTSLAFFRIENLAVSRSCKQDPALSFHIQELYFISSPKMAILFLSMDQGLKNAIKTSLFTGLRLHGKLIGKIKVHITAKKQQQKKSLHYQIIDYCKS